jgi:hypothetical protein
MTRRFWAHVGICSIISIVVALLSYQTGYEFPRSGLPVTSIDWLQPFRVLLLIPLVYVVARLLLRVTRNDRPASFVSLYALSIFLPIVSALVRSPTIHAGVILVLFAVLEILDSDIVKKNSLRAGIYISLATLLVPGTAPVAILCLPVVVRLTFPRWRPTARYVLGVVLPFAVAGTVVGLIQGFSGVLPEMLLDWPTTPASFTRMAQTHADAFRELGDAYFLASYAALGTAAVVLASARGIVASRRGIFVIAWLALGLAGLAAFEQRGWVLLAVLGSMFAMVLANVGFTVFSMSNISGTSRLRMIPLGILFFLPPILSWIRLLS